MTTTIRFVITGLLLLTAILSILLWKRTDLTVDRTPGVSIKATVYDYTTVLPPDYSLDKPEHLIVLKNEEMEKLVEQFDRKDLITAIKMMPEHIQVQDKFLLYLSAPEAKKVESSRKFHARLWNQLIFRLDSSQSLKDKLLNEAQEVREYHSLHNLSENENTKADKVQEKMDEENKLERELEKEQSLINQLEAEIIDLKKKDQEVKSEIDKLEQNLANLRKTGRKTPY